MSLVLQGDLNKVDKNFNRFVFRFQFDEKAYSRNNFFVVKRLRIHWVEL
ncbi:hypothetical protein LEP1GSC089_1773 [Leptospira interrogans serovar Autumnalis str. LP101]|uniref:Uncharacterized protein n=1 Tax=Leptospira interrogans serovar Pyrogenes str. 200701872 TaxID=1193029 RepID=M6ZT68_LEPIR|nr:hypothetical protein LEP1GSC089_1773 [Leptospira interrogans serovar Autumnalis str. LP101]EMN78495.1 hypothetical protein LEP1GSC106_2944 [Leptospira interrogans serovar Grippotyphosa str. UI 12764]EMP07452.1 hypothetical protein LEP1GSC124_4120 [Leptospira interrogans serovar Pyrogenes str. 200701872]